MELCVLIIRVPCKSMRSQLALRIEFIEFPNHMITMITICFLKVFEFKIPGSLWPYLFAETEQTWESSPSFLE